VQTLAHLRIRQVGYHNDGRELLTASHGHGGETIHCHMGFEARSP